MSKLHQWVVLVLLPGCVLLGYDPQDSPDAGDGGLPDVDGSVANDGGRDAGAPPEMDATTAEAGPTEAGTLDADREDSGDEDSGDEDSGGPDPVRQCVVRPDGSTCGSDRQCRDGQCLHEPGCTTDGCNEVCEDPVGCVFACNGSTNQCIGDCQSERVCVFECEQAERCVPGCRPGSSCDIECAGAERCDVVCDDAECQVDCHDAEECDSVVCKNGSVCTLHCGEEDDCGFSDCWTEVAQCEDGRLVCGGSC